MTDLGATYIRTRSREVRILRGRARLQVERAKDQMRLARMRGDTEGILDVRRVLVRCLANLYIADAFCDALETVP